VLGILLLAGCHLHLLTQLAIMAISLDMCPVELLFCFCCVVGDRSLCQIPLGLWNHTSGLSVL